VSGTFSVNDQRDGNLRQNLRATDPITLDDASVRSYGYTGQAAKSWSGRHTLIFGGDLYDERIDSFRIVTAPATGVRTEQRALYPNGSRYRTFGTFAQASFELLPQRLRAMVSGRFTNIGFETFANRNRTSDGRQLGVTDTQQDFRDLTYQASLTWRATQMLSLHVLAGRGFRAPNLNDLGAVGLNDLGFEIPASDSVGAGALLGNSSGENALSLNRSVAGLSPESLRNYEAGVTFRTDRLYVRVQGFHADLYDPIVRRTLLFPAGSVPSSIGGIAVTPITPTPAQQAQGVVTVATAVDPRAVKAFVNDGQTRYYGTEWIARVAIARHLSTEAGYSFLVGRDLYPNRNVRRLPPQSGMWSVRYQPRRWWVEARAIASGAQTRLSGGDIDDERIGASRRRSDIADFFNGTLISPWIANGRFTPTGETLTEIQNRVLPVGAVINGVQVATNATRVPLYLSTAGWVSVDVVGGLPIGERWTIGGGIRNLADRNYRLHGSGVDSTGRNLFANLQYRW
jgi:outer membrane receptor protein involved in Fe transport